MTMRVLQGSTNRAFFEDFIAQLLCPRTPFPQLRSVILRDNPPFHCTDPIKRICSNAGVNVIFLAPYSPDLNPIEEFFAELKAFIKRHWSDYADAPEQDLVSFYNGVLMWLGEERKVHVGTSDMQE